MDLSSVLDNQETQKKITELCQAIDFFAERGWCPATSSNFSLRPSPEVDFAVVSESGKDKSLMTEKDFLLVSLDGQEVFPRNKRPSAETKIHLELYLKTRSQCVLHTHSLVSALLTTNHEKLQYLEWHSLELLKAFPGHSTHQTTGRIYVVENSQDMNDIWAELLEKLDFSQPHLPVFVIRGHGLYAWGDSIFAAKRHVEAGEFLLAYALQGGACAQFY